MFIPNTTGQLSRRTGTDVYSQPIFSTPATVNCAVVHLNLSVDKTSVRTDSSASRSNAEEQKSVAKLLLPSDVTIAKGDRFVILGAELRVIMIQPRNNVLGVLDHYEVDFDRWTQ